MPDQAPTGAHGTMTADDWRSVMDQAVALGVSMVQFIGGEPTMHPEFAELLRHALDARLAVEVYTNLTHVKNSWWELFANPGVSLATSFYSDSAAEHENITRRRGSHARTLANIREAVRRGIPLRAGIIGVDDGQRVDQARAELDAIGVTGTGIDRLRQVGRGVRTREPGVSELCGHCGLGVAAISPDGDVWPCVFSRWINVGNIRSASLHEILTGRAMGSALASLEVAFGREWPCTPKMCDPQCGPKCSPDCDPVKCQPNPDCVPRYSCGPCHPKDRVCQPDLGCKPNKCRPS